MPIIDVHLQVSQHLFACLPDSLLNAQGKQTNFIAQLEHKHPLLLHRAAQDYAYPAPGEDTCWVHEQNESAAPSGECCKASFCICMCMDCVYGRYISC